MKTKLTLLTCTLFIIACDDQANIGRIESPIVGGNIETGFPAVGALVFGMGYWIESFCTGTLIAPKWILTAGHCVTPNERMPITPGFVKFMIGNDTHGKQGKGVLYSTKAFYPHPKYNPKSMLNEHDIALVELTDVVTDVEPIPINTTALDGSLIGKPILFVGFGAANGNTLSGSGVKRSGYMPLVWIESETYSCEPQGTGTCYGDSGGPGLINDNDGKYKVIGVISAGAEVIGAGDPCLSGYGIYTRVDAYAGWISEVTGVTLPPCNGLCLCEEACLSNGACDNSRCEVLTCPQYFLCAKDCKDEACRVNCHLRATSKAKANMTMMTYCQEKYCPSSIQDQMDCIDKNCNKQVSQCIQDAEPEMTCREYDECLQLCKEDLLCARFCDALAFDEAKKERDFLVECLSQKCGITLDPVGLLKPCAQGQCSNQIEACFPPPCNLWGGSCKDGLACVIGSQGKPSKCVPTKGFTEGESCKPSEKPECADGLICYKEKCTKVCVNETHCKESEMCIKGKIGSDIGICEPVSKEDGEDSENLFEEIIENEKNLGDAVVSENGKHDSQGCDVTNRPAFWPLALVFAFSLKLVRREKVKIEETNQ